MEMVINKANVRVFDGVNLNSNQTSVLFELRQNSLYCVQHKWSGFTGTVTIYTEGTNFMDSTDDTEWFQVDTCVLNTGTGTRGINVEKAGYPFVRVRIVQTSGTGTLTTIINAKVL